MRPSDTPPTGHVNGGNKLPNIEGWMGAEPSRAKPSRPEPSRAEPSRAEPGWAMLRRAKPSRAETRRPQTAPEPSSKSIFSPP